MPVAATTAGPATQAQVAAFLQVPLSFEANQGQTAAAVNFLARGQGYGLYLTSTAAVLSLNASTGTGNNVVGMQLIGANAAASSAGVDPQAGVVNYFIGDDPAQWHTDIATFGRAQYQDVYDGIDVAYYGNQGQLEYDFTVAPGANPGQIRLGFTGTTGMQLDSAGNLVLQTTGGDVVEEAPVLYQTTAAGRQSVSGAYVLLGNGQVGFQIGTYDPSLPLVIDPALSYSTYLGGSLGDEALAVAVNASGDAYITGQTGSPNFPITSGAYQTTPTGENTETDAFVTELSPAGQLVYSTFLGGVSDNHGTGIAIDSSGDAYVTGWTDSTSFPVTAGAFQTSYNGGPDGFVTKLNATGSALIYSTYLGGSDENQPNAIAVDSQGFAYVVGETYSTDFPTMNPIQGGVENSNEDAFLTKLNQNGTGLVYSTYIRGSLNDAAYGVAVDSSGEAIVVGSTESQDFPTTANAFQTTLGGDPTQTVTNAFITKINAAGTAYVYSTYLGGSIETEAMAVATDSAGDAYVTGQTFDPDFPVTDNAAQQTKGFTDMDDLSNAFVTKFDPSGALVYSTFLGGGGQNAHDGGQGIAVDSQGNAFVTGFTADTSTPFPLDFPIQTTPGQAASYTAPTNYDAFVTEVSADGSTFEYSSYLGGGTTPTYGEGIGLDANDNAYVVGMTASIASAGGGTVDNFPLLNPIDSTPPSDQTGDTTGFVARVNLLEPGAGTIYFPSEVTETTGAGNFVTIQVARRDGDTTAASINYATSNGTAVAGTNYTSASGTINFAVGQHVATFTVPISDDLAAGSTPYLTFHLTLSNPTNGAVLDDSASTSDVDIYDVNSSNTSAASPINDFYLNALPLAGSSVTATGSNVNATTDTGPDDDFDFPVTDSKSVYNPKNAGGASVWWIWSPPATGLATINTFGSNFDTLLSVFSLNNHLVENDDAPGRTDGTGAVTFLAIEGQAYRICVQGYNDGDGPAEGNIVLNINGAASAGTLEFTEPTYDVNETGGTVTVSVTRTGGSAGAISVLVNTSDGTAHAGTNYTAVVNETLTWATGDTTSRNVVIPIINNDSTGQSPTFNVTLTDATGGASIGSPNPTVVVILENDQAPAFTSAGSTTFTVGASGTFTVTASGTPAPTLGESNSDTLPSGVTFTASTGVLSGTPAANTGGTYTLHFTAANGVGSNATQTFTLTVNQAPAITSASSTAFTTGTAGSFSVTASGAPPPTLNESGSDTLPSGVTFTPATGILAGTPATGSGGTYTLHFTAHNGVGSDANQTFTLTVNQAPAFTSASSTAFAVGSSGSFTVTANGTPAPALSEDAGDTLPSGVTFTAATGVLAGTPAAGSAGTYTLHFTAHNGIGANATQTFTLTVTTTQPPAFTSGNATSFAVGASGSFTVTVSGVPTPTLTENNSDTLPSGVTFTAATGILAGTPAAGSAGTYTLHFTAANGVGSNATQTFTLTVNQAPAFTSASSTTFTVGASGTFAVTARGVPSPTLSESNSDTLPSGVTFTASTGMLSGTPAANTGGTYTLHFTAANGVGSNATQTFTLTVNQAPAITSASSASFTAGTQGSFAVTASGTPPPTLSESNSDTLPSGVTFTPATGILAGTPAPGTGGTYTLHFTAANGVGSNANQIFTLTVNQAAAFTSASSAAFAVGASDKFTVTASGTPTPVLSESGSDTLPSGVTFTAATGVLAGTPAAGSAGTYTLHFTAHNGIGADATQTFTLTVTTTQPPAFTSSNATTFAVGASGSFMVTAGGVPAPTLSESNSDTLPAGVTFTPATGSLAGTPAAGTGGTYTLHFTAANGVGADATQIFTLTVNQPPAFTSANSTSFNTGTASSFTVTASGTPTPTLSEQAGDTLPSGVTFTPATGVLAGNPTASGTYTLHFIAHNGIGSDATQTFTLSVSPSNFSYNAAAMTLTITANAPTNTFTYSQATTEDASGTLHSTYNFTLNGVTQSYTNSQVDQVFVKGTATSSNTAILITNDTYLDNTGKTQETTETISLGSLNQAGAGTMFKYGANGNPYTFLTLSNFPISYAYVGRNDGTVSLYGTAGVAYNGFVSAGNYSYIGGPGLYHEAQGATSVYGYSAGQPSDFAYQYSANPGSAFVVSGVAFSYMSCTDQNPNANNATQSFFNVGVGFLVNTGVSKNPGQDYAYIIDSPGNDTFVGGNAYSYMYIQNGGGYAELDTAYAFALVYAESFVGGTDTAINGDPNKNILGGNWNVQ